jgi:outer membrane protein, heavy metal efflux system
MLSAMPRTVALLVLPSFLILSTTARGVFGHGQIGESGIVSKPGARRVPGLPGPRDAVRPSSGSPSSSTVSLYFDPVQGSSSSDLVQRALSSNAEISAVRLDIQRGRARLRQAGLRPNPTIDFEQTTGRFTGSLVERETSVAFALPLELGGKRQRRIDLARLELEAAEAEVADRERRLIADVRTGYAEAMASLRELEITENLNNLDVQTARIVEVRVTEGESSPLESNLLRVEVDRLKARRALIEGRLQAAMLRLKTLAGISASESLRLGEDLVALGVPEPLASVDAFVDIALRTRPDLRLARLTEEAAEAGLRLARAQATPDVTAFSKYTVNRSIFDNTPVGVLRDQDKLLTFGVSIGIPVLNRNQGAKAEAQAAIAQSRKRREFVETVVRSEVASAYARYEAAQSAMATLEKGVLARSAENIRSIRGAYEIGAFRVTDLLVEQRRYVDSQREFIEAMAERYRALADLQSAIGAAVNLGEKKMEK